MIQSFQEGKDIYATLASITYKVPYEDCLEFKNGVYSPEGKKRRSAAKVILLAILYGKEVASIAQDLYGKDKEMSDDDKLKNAQRVYDSVLNSFPALRALMSNSQAMARQKGYVETILGRRRHIPDMQLPKFEYKALPGYVNPFVDPLDVDTLNGNSEIPESVIAKIDKELNSLKWDGQIYKRIRELNEKEKIKVIWNKRLIVEASRQCVNSCIQGEQHRPYSLNSIAQRCVA